MMLLFFIVNFSEVKEMKKEWKVPCIEVLDISLTMKGHKPPGGGGGNNPGGGGETTPPTPNPIPGLDS